MRLWYFFRSISVPTYCTHSTHLLHPSTHLLHLSTHLLHLTKIYSKNPLFNAKYPCNLAINCKYPLIAPNFYVSKNPINTLFFRIGNYCLFRLLQFYCDSYYCLSFVVPAKALYIGVFYPLS